MKPVWIERRKLMKSLREFLVDLLIPEESNKRPKGYQQ